MPVKYFEIAALFLLPLIAVLIPILLGQRIGNYQRKKSPDEELTPSGNLIAAAFGLLAFMLGFTFSIVTNRFEDRQQLLLNEVTTIRTTYLRAGLLPEPFRSGTKKLMIEYVDLHADLIRDRVTPEVMLSRSQLILDSCWKYAEALAEQDRSSEVYSLYTSTINDLIDSFHQRIALVLAFRIPPPILWILFFISFFSMLLLGYEFGTSGKISWGLKLTLAIIFALAMF